MVVDADTIDPHDGLGYTLKRQEGTLLDNWPAPSIFVFSNLVNGVREGVVPTVVVNLDGRSLRQVAIVATSLFDRFLHRDYPTKPGSSGRLREVSGEILGRFSPVKIGGLARADRCPLHSKCMNVWWMLA